MKKLDKIIQLLYIACLLIAGVAACDKTDDPGGDGQSTGTVKDADGNKYHTVKIGDQVWMVENLKTTKYSNGDAIPYVKDNDEWLDLEIGGYCDYENKANNSETYGRLYNWYAVNDSRKIAPKGWHVPSDEEWTQLSTFLGGYKLSGGKLKEKGFAHWKEPNTGATNETGFTALPGGYFAFDDEFDALGEYGRWWTSSDESSFEAIPRNMYFDDSDLGDIRVNKEFCFSVRCVKD